MRLIDRLLDTALATIWDILPLVAILLLFQLAVLRWRPANPRRVALGVVYVFLGLTLFIVGLEEALFPIGRTMARQLSAPEFLGLDAAMGGWRDYAWTYAFAAAIGFATTVAEPALIAVALKASEISGGAIPSFGLRVAVALGVALGVCVGCLRIVTGTPLALYIVVGYVVVLLQTLTAPKLIVSLAFDSGGVTTSTVTVPVVTALGLGLAASVPGRNPLVDGFGLIAFASLFPIMTVMAYAWLAEHWGGRRRGGKRRGEP